MTVAFRILLHFLIYLSLAWTVLICLQLRANPAMHLMVDARAAQIAAAADRAIAQVATKPRIDSLIASRLAEVPRNWVALEHVALNPNHILPP